MGHVKILTDHHPQAILNYHPALQKPFLKLQRGDPLDVEKKIFKSSFYQSHVMAFGLTIPKWYNT